MVSSVIASAPSLNPLKAPKGLSPAAKQAIILEWFRNSLSAFPLSELEKAIPAATGVAKQLVKELLQALIDEGLLRVEKIGISNWYWSFVSDAKQSKEKMINDLQVEELKMKTTLGEIEKQMEEEAAQRQDDNEEMLEGDGKDRTELPNLHERLLQETNTLAKELATYSDSDPTEVLRKAEETKKLKDDTEKWTENLEAIESYLRKQTGDREQVAMIMQQCCGDEYVAGEGLKEL